MTDADVVLDQRGQRCPMPIVALGRAAKEASSGTVIEVICTDPGAEYDVPAWCAMVGAAYLGSSATNDGAVAYRVLVGPVPPPASG